MRSLCHFSPPSIAKSPNQQIKNPFHPFNPLTKTKNLPEFLSTLSANPFHPFNPLTKTKNLPEFLSTLSANPFHPFNPLTKTKNLPEFLSTLSANPFHPFNPLTKTKNHGLVRLPVVWKQKPRAHRAPVVW